MTLIGSRKRGRRRPRFVTTSVRSWLIGLGRLLIGRSGKVMTRMVPLMKGTLIRSGRRRWKIGRVGFRGRIILCWTLMNPRTFIRAAAGCRGPSDH